MLPGLFRPPQEIHNRTKLTQKLNEILIVFSVCFCGGQFGALFEHRGVHPVNKSLVPFFGTRRRPLPGTHFRYWSALSSAVTQVRRLEDPGVTLSCVLVDSLLLVEAEICFIRKGDHR